MVDKSPSGAKPTTLPKRSDGDVQVLREPLADLLAQIAW